MDHSELGENFGKFRFKFVEAEDVDKVLDILEQYLFRCMEPMGYKPEGAEDLRQVFSGILKSGLNMSYMAVDTETGEIACVRVVELTKKEGFDPMHIPDFFKHSFNTNWFWWYQHLFKDINLFEKYDITEHPDMFGICTLDKYRQQGLATEMYKRGLDYLKKRGYKFVKCSFISPYSRKAGLRHGYTPFVSKRFEDMRNPEGELLNPDADKGPDGYICIGGFDIRNRVVA